MPPPRRRPLAFQQFLAAFRQPGATHPMEDLLSARIHLVQAANAPTVEDHIHHLQASLECGLRWSKTVAAEMRRQVEASRR